MKRQTIPAILLSLLCINAKLSAAVVPVTDTNLLNGLTPYNWACRPDSVSATANGAGFTLGFKNTSQVTLLLDNAHLAGFVATRCPIISWTVNGGPLRTHQLASGENSILLASDASNPVIDLYIKGMSPFEDRYSGDVPPNSVKITGFSIEDNGTTTATALPKKIWLNIGDSIMSGDAALYAAGQGRPADDLWAASDEGRASYGYLLAKHYGYRESRLAYGGYNWGGGLASVPALSTLIDQRTSTTSRLKNGLLDPLPDIVLINLGENGVPAANDVTQALTKLRSRVKRSTKVIVMIPASGSARAMVTQAFNTYTNSTKDTYAFLVDLGSVTFATADGQHPTAAGHQSIYNAALPAMNPIIHPNPFRITPIGDSITAGYTDNPNWTVPFQFGYRSGLYSRLTNSDIPFQFAGSSPQPWNGFDGIVTNAPTIDLRLVDQDHHEGYGGRNTTYFLSNIKNWLTLDHPNIILLMAGINDIGLGSTAEPVNAELNLSNIVATVMSNSPSTHVIVAQITPYASYTDAIVKYNNYIANVLVPSFASQGKRVSMVNQYTNLCIPGTTNIDSTLFSNGINHPNAAAYDRMAQTWFNGIQALNLPPSPPSSLAVIQNTQPATATAFIGDQISFSAQFYSDLTLNYQWQVISGGITNNIQDATNSVLTLPNLKLTDTASYQLVASNALGVVVSSPSSLTISSLPAPVNNLITAIATETGRGIGVFVPGWSHDTNKSLIAGQAPSSAIGNFSLEIPGRDVKLLTAGDNGALSVIAGTSGNTSSTNYVTCGNGGGAGASLTYTLTGSTNGYDLTNITVFGGWADNGRDQQAYTIYYATAMAPSSFKPLATVNYNPSVNSGIQSAVRVSLQPTNGYLATNVAAVKFDFSSPASENGYCGYNQINIFGSVGSPVTITNQPLPVLTPIPQAASGSTAFDGALAVNLIRNGQNSLKNVTVSHGPSISSVFTTAGLNNGSASGNSSLTYYGSNDGSGGNLPVTITFNLNTNNAPLGYTINSVASITGWGDSHLANQTFQLLLSINGGAFVDYGTFNAATTLNGGNNSIFLTVTNTAGAIATGVTAVQFIFMTPSGPQGGSGGTLIRELEVFGSPIVKLSSQMVSGNNLQFSWNQGTLLEATNVTGPWATNSTPSPLTVNPNSGIKFYRVRVQ